MDKHLVRVDETRNVSELKIENLSGDLHVFIQAGDIVKGGQQDRTLITDLVLPPKSPQPIGSFCVEQGRWSRRVGESAAAFPSENASSRSKPRRSATTATHSVKTGARLIQIRVWDTAGHGWRAYFFAFFALNFAQRALAAAEIFALAAALILRLFLSGAGAPAFAVEGCPPMIRLSSFSRSSIFSRIAMACLSCWSDMSARRLDGIGIQ